MAAPIRGPLRFETKTSTPQIEAGKEFSVFVTITNPYDVPATIKAVGTRLPAKLYDVEAAMLEIRRAKYQKQLGDSASRLIREQVGDLRKSAEEKSAAKRDLLESLIRAMPFGDYVAAGSAAARYVKASTLASGDELKVLEFEPERLDAVVAEIKASANPAETIHRTITTELQKHIANEDSSQKRNIVLQPGNSTVQVFTLRTTHSVFFSPSSYTLSIQIEYEIDDKLNQHTSDCRLDIRAPLMSLILGSIVGSTMGFLIRDIFETKALVALLQTSGNGSFVVWFIGLIGNILLGVLVVISFARKKDTQPILAIEDIWGGVFVGFLAGYAGKSMLSQIAPGGGSHG